MEVAEAMSAYPDVQEVNVYGVAVPGNEGRAGMASVIFKNITENDVNWSSLYEFLDKNLPGNFHQSVHTNTFVVYARPLFIRVQKEMQTTATFKQIKHDLIKQGFDPAVVPISYWFFYLPFCR
jgi:fatty-acyl-CoA synthase